MTTGYARSLKELRVYQKAREVARTVYRLSQAFPKEETYSLTDQIRRSVRSVGAQIEEGWGNRRYEKHFVCKLTDADAGQMETQHWVGEALDCGYLTPAEASRLNANLEEIGRMLNSMMEKADAFCSVPSVVFHKNATKYFASAHCPPITDY